MKNRLLWIVIIVLVILITLARAQTPEPTWVIMERSVVLESNQQLIPDSPEMRSAFLSAVDKRRSQEEAEKFLAKRCRDMGEGPLVQCTQRMIALVMDEDTAEEWEEALRGRAELNHRATQTISFAFCRALTPASQRCYLGE